MQAANEPLKIWERVKRSAIVPVEHRAGFRRETAARNAARVRMLSAIFFAVSGAFAVYLTVFQSINGFLSTPHAVGMHIANAAAGALFFTTMTLLKRKERLLERWATPVAFAFILYILAWSTLFSLFAQESGGQITLFIIGLVGTSVVAYLDPRLMAATYALAWLGFTVALPFFQDDPILQLSHSLNTTYLALVSWFMVALLYVNHIRDYLQKETIRKQNERLEYLSTVDPLTEAGNRRKFDEVLALEMRRAAREKATLAIAIADIDQFKDYNDHYGHIEGDDCLKKVAGAIAGLLRRPGDSVYRFGGEEFAILMPNTALDGALAHCDAIRAAVEQLAVPHAGSQTGIVTISLGVVAIVPKPGETERSLMERADRMLYRAKSAGRNRVEGVT
jgi:diguanylate cyclase (GGDEF)-like protein